jgi:hypothetical protein
LGCHRTLGQLRLNCLGGGRVNQVGVDGCWFLVRGQVAGQGGDHQYQQRGEEAKSFGKHKHSPSLQGCFKPASNSNETSAMDRWLLV